MHGVVFTPTFLRQAEREGVDDDALLAIASVIAANPESGDLIAGTGGARKLRHAVAGRGKSGGLRSIHYFGGGDVPIFLLAIYGKGTKANLSRAERNQLAAILPGIARAYRKRDGR